VTVATIQAAGALFINYYNSEDNCWQNAEKDRRGGNSYKGFLSKIISLDFGAP
jgi:hypothetical protein